MCLISIRGVFFVLVSFAPIEFILFCSLLISFSNLILNLLLFFCGQAITTLCFHDGNTHTMFVNVHFCLVLDNNKKNRIQRIAIQPYPISPSAILIYSHFVFIPFDTPNTFSHSSLCSWLFVYTHTHTQTQTRHISSFSQKWKSIIFSHCSFIKHIQFQRVSLRSVTENVNIFCSCSSKLPSLKSTIQFTVTNTLSHYLLLSLSVSHTHKHQHALKKTQKYIYHLIFDLFYWKKKKTIELYIWIEHQQKNKQYKK